MRVAMIPYAVDENEIPLSFVPGWIRALSRHVERLHVVTPWEGSHEPFPGNVSVYSLRKDEGKSKFSRLGLLYRTVWRILHTEGLDVCFVHMHTAMTPLVWPLLRIHGVPIVSWYAHGHTDKTIPLTHRLSQAIVTPTASSYRYRHDDKVYMIGHGIDETLFMPLEGVKRKGIVSIGRISPVKNLHVLVEAVALLRDAGTPVSCRIVGNVPDEHREYVSFLQQRVRDLKLSAYIHFLPPVPNTETVATYNSATLHVNCAPSANAMDKAILEAAFCGTPSLTSVLSLRETYGGDLSERLIFEAGNPQDLANKILSLPACGTQEYSHIQQKLRDAVQGHALSAFMTRLYGVFTRYGQK